MEEKSDDMMSGDDPSIVAKEDESDELESVSSESIVHKSYAIISHNTELLVLIVLGIIKTSLIAMGFWPAAMRPTDLFGPDQLDWDLKDTVYQVSEFVEMAGFYTVHFYLAAYILLPYPILTNKQSVVLTPWLMCGVLRLVVLKLVEGMAGVLLCSAHTSLHYPCLKFTFWQALEFGLSLYLWTSVHSFYHYLQRTKSSRTFGRVMQSINIASIRNSIRHDTVESLSFAADCHLDDDDDDEGPETENVLFERAAMAWIWREILESGEDYVTDSQFSQYLLIKATIELRQILRELSEKRETQKNALRKSMNEKIKDSLEFCRQIAKQEEDSEKFYEQSSKTGWQQAFDENRSMSNRDPLKRIPPLIFGGKPFLDEESVDSEERTLLMSIAEEDETTSGLSAMPTPDDVSQLTSSLALSPSLMSSQAERSIISSSSILSQAKQSIISPSPMLSQAEQPIISPSPMNSHAGRSIEVQTDPLSPELQSLFEVLQEKHSREQKKKA